MFVITEETKAKAVEEMKKVLLQEDGAHLENCDFEEAFDAAVKIVMAQFGL